MDKPLAAPEADAPEPLTSLWERAEAARAGEREAVVEQALLLLDQFFVHLPAAQSRGINPIERLKSLRRGSPAAAGSFYRELLSIFAEVGDRHTDCNLPEPFAGRVAFLPLLLRDYFCEGETCLAVVASAVEGLRRGDLLVSWNGVPVAEVLRRQAAQQLGANSHARYAKAVQTLTFRPLDWMPPPDEPEVTLEFAGPEARARKLRLPWRVAGRAWLDMRFGGLVAEGEEDGRREEKGLSSSLWETPHGTFGCLKIRSLHARPETFLPLFVKALESVPREGLVLDLRGCEHGIISTAELLLQLFTAQSIEPQSFQFRITESLRRVVQNNPALRRWRAPVEAAASRGDCYSEGLPLTPAEQANSIGQRYKGPVVVLVDALTYSSAEVFAAGFQDHGLGTVLGTARRTGGGGASLWRQETIHRLSGDARLRPLDGAPTFRVAVRRCRRVRALSGQTLEGVGVTPDALHMPTRADLLNDDSDLRRRVAKILAENRDRA